MTCDDLSHRLPDVAANRSRFTADEQRHVETCVECSGELKLLVLTARLGHDLGPVRQPEETAGKVLARLAAGSPRRPRAVLVAAGLAAAAALAVAIRSALPPDPADIAPAAIPRVASAPALIALPELDGMAEGELELVLDQLDRLLDNPLRDAEVYPADDAELARLLTAGDA